MINTKDISVIVQGAVDNQVTPKALKSIRTYLPDAEIILSTWEGTDVSGLDYDIVLLNKDPEAYIYYWKNKRQNNVNRQLVSVQQGLKRATKKYVLKIRTDCVLDNTAFLLHFDLFNHFNPDFKIFQHKVLACSVCSREYACGTGLPVPFHVSDFWFFGLAEDIRNYFDETPLMTKEQAAEWHHKFPDRTPDYQCFWAYPPEQYYAVSWAKRHFDNIQFDDWSEWTLELFNLSQNIIYNNFIFLDYKRSGILSEKHKSVFFNDDESGRIYYDTFIKRYISLFGENALPNIYLKEPIKIKKYIVKLKKHCHNFIVPIKKIIRWIGEPLAILWYGLKIIIHTVTQIHKLF